MARRRKRDTTDPDTLPNTSLETVLLSPPRPLSPVRPPSLPISRYDLLTETVEVLGDDGRYFHPSGPRRPQMRATGQVAQIRRTYSNIKHQLEFFNGKSVIRCMRRKARREILFAFNKQRKRGAKGGKYHRNHWSKVKC